MSKAIEQLKRAHQLMSIQKKDFSLKDLFTGEQTEAKLLVTAISSKYVQKYDNPQTGCLGFHTTLYLKDDKITGAFSNALLDLARFFFKSSGMNSDSEFNHLSFKTAENPEGHIELLVTKIPLDGGKTTYNFKILDGEVGQVEKLGSPSELNTLALGTGEVNNQEH